jgi:imidazolonepropionase-like amidohydrolase
VSVVLTGATVFDGTGSDPYPAAVRIEDGTIVEVGADLPGDERIDVSGLTLMPGLIDCHVHLVIDPLGPEARSQLPFSFQFYAAAKNLERTLDRGFTTVRDAGGADLGIKTAVERGLIDGPDVVISITLLSQTGGHADFWTVDGCRHSDALAPHPGRPSSIVDGVEEMRRRVRELLRAGADVIKVCATGGVVSPNDKPDHPQFSAEELEVCVAEAAKNGVPVMAHALGAAGIKNALRAGVRSIEHGVYADDECLSLMRNGGAWLVPTLAAPHGLLKIPGLPAVVREKARQVIATGEELVRRAVQANVRIALGTDSGVLPHGNNSDELAVLEAAGMSARQVLVAATSSAADLLQLGDRGRIAPGCLGDIVAVAGDPFDLKTYPDRLRMVLKRGRIARTFGDASGIRGQA